jgi:NADH:ubiquinone oxidoreductase subunit E
MNGSNLSQITICMGSSCFSRGNNRNLEVIQNFLKNRSMTGEVELTGHLCQGFCNKGPNVTINGKMFHDMNPAGISDLLVHVTDKPAP